MQKIPIQSIRKISDQVFIFGQRDSFSIRYMGSYCLETIESLEEELYFYPVFSMNGDVPVLELEVVSAFGRPRFGYVEIKAVDTLAVNKVLQVLSGWNHNRWIAEDHF